MWNKRPSKTTHKITLWNVISYNFSESGPKPPKDWNTVSTIGQAAFGGWGNSLLGGLKKQAIQVLDLEVDDPALR